METYKKIVEVAYNLFANYGYEKTSLSMIAKEVGISKAALYYHFSSKEGLFIKLLDYVIEGISEFNNLKIDSYNKDNFKRKLLEVGLADISYQQQNQDFSMIMNQFMIYSITNKQVKDKLLGIIELHLSDFKKLLNHGVNLGVIEKEINIDVKAQLLTMALGFMGDYIGYGFDFSYELIWHDLVNSLFI